MQNIWKHWCQVVNPKPEPCNYAQWLYPRAPSSGQFIRGGHTSVSQLTSFKCFPSQLDGSRRRISQPFPTAHRTSASRRNQEKEKVSEVSIFSSSTQKNAAFWLTDRNSPCLQLSETHTFISWISQHALNINMTFQSAFLLHELDFGSVLFIQCSVLNSQQQSPQNALYSQVKTESCYRENLNVSCF